MTDRNEQQSASDIGEFYLIFNDRREYENGYALVVPPVTAITNAVIGVSNAQIYEYLHISQFVVHYFFVMKQRKKAIPMSSYMYRKGYIC